MKTEALRVDPEGLDADETEVRATLQQIGWIVYRCDSPRCTYYRRIVTSGPPPSATTLPPSCPTCYEQTTYNDPRDQETTP